MLYLKHWRPITLNVDYKIAPKAIAKRIQPMLPQIIHADQTGFNKGRYIGENIRLVDDLIGINQYRETLRLTPSTRPSPRVRYYGMAAYTTRATDIQFWRKLKKVGRSVGPTEKRNC